MRRGNFCIKVLVIAIIIFLIDASILSNICGNPTKNVSNHVTGQLYSPIDEIELDYDFIYNITENLSNIIFTQYNESKGELPKGRAFGTKGEREAARIIFDNLSLLGLEPKREWLNDSKYHNDYLASKIEVLAYRLNFTNTTNNVILNVSSLPIRSLLGPHNTPLQITNNITYNGLKIVDDHPPKSCDTEDYIIMKIDEEVKNKSEVLDILPSIKGLINNYFEYIKHPHFVGFIRVDINNNTRNMWQPGKTVPTFSIDGENGTEIFENRDNYTANFYLKQRWNPSVQSCNVIGEIEGKDTEKTILVCCLYDSWWCQGAGDSIQKKLFLSVVYMIPGGVKVQVIPLLEWELFLV